MTEPTRSSGRLSVVTATADGIRVLRLTGEIDHDTGVILRHALEAADGARPRTVLDLSRLTFMDSTGINIVIAAPSGSVRRTLRIVGVDDIIDCRETLHQALSI
ncbi:STAS domain-containing protein [Streptomyces sp. NPDC048324]|uniref:STAS domain-containing protein n=1 Tax=Streptomyces sp. NPDC048324 TaxID=3157205 RepID=UPI0034419201